MSRVLRPTRMSRTKRTETEASATEDELLRLPSIFSYVTEMCRYVDDGTYKYIKFHCLDSLDMVGFLLFIHFNEKAISPHVHLPTYT